MLYSKVNVLNTKMLAIKAKECQELLKNQMKEHCKWLVSIRTENAIFFHAEVLGYTDNTEGTVARAVRQSATGQECQVYRNYQQHTSNYYSPTYQHQLVEWSAFESLGG
jgi:DNA-directed RNA polymerase subunit H (RpoH/RPB5)